MRVLSWFSCGAASARATVFAAEKYGNIEAVYTRVAQEHEDNLRFLDDFVRVTGIPVKTIENEKHKGDIFDVFFYYKFLKGQKGAPCTLHLKKNVRKSYQKPDDIQVFGYTKEEQHRADRFIDSNPDVNEWFPLIENEVSKAECLEFIKHLGIEIPVMYRLGYKNNNCIGCVKGGMGYWNKIRVDFPDAFDKMAKAERLLGHSLLREKVDDKYVKVFLDELDPKRGHALKDMPEDCGFTCEWKQGGKE